MTRVGSNLRVAPQLLLRGEQSSFADCSAIGEARRAVLAWLLTYTGDSESKISDMLSLVDVSASTRRRALTIRVRARDDTEHSRRNNGQSEIGVAGMEPGILDRLGQWWGDDLFCCAGKRLYIFASVPGHGGKCEDIGRLAQIASAAAASVNLRGELLIGVGGVANEGRSLKRSLDEAVSCALLLENGAGEEAVRYGANILVLEAERSFVNQLLRLISDERALGDFVERWIGPLLRHDETRGTEFVRTLEAYLDAGGILREAASRLYLHPNGVRYRLDRLFDLLDIDRPTTEWKLCAHLAVKAARLLGRENRQPAPLAIGTARQHLARDCT